MNKFEKHVTILYVSFVPVWRISFQSQIVYLYDIRSKNASY